MQLSGSDIEDVGSTVAAYITQFLELIESKIESAKDKTARLDLSNTIPSLTLDMITYLCLGNRSTVSSVKQIVLNSSKL
jgi:hypothetical protein